MEIAKGIWTCLLGLILTRGPSDDCSLQEEESRNITVILMGVKPIHYDRNECLLCSGQLQLWDSDPLGEIARGFHKHTVLFVWWSLLDSFGQVKHPASASKPLTL